MAAVAERAVAVALLGRADDARAQLRLALDELGAAVVVEADPTAVAVGDISAGRPDVVLVNLEPGLEDALDHLQPLFDNPDVRVVFNESEVSSQLSGWDRARWARHLAAKLLGHGRTMPPPPPGAEILPDMNLVPSPGAPLTPAQMTGDVALEGFTAEAEGSADSVPSEPRLDALEIGSGFEDAMTVAPQAADAAPAAEEFDLDLGEIADALATSGAKPEVQGASVPDAAPPTDESFSYAFDPVGFELEPDAAPQAQVASLSEDLDGQFDFLDADTAEATRSGFDASLDESVSVAFESVALDDGQAASVEEFDGLDLEPATEAAAEVEVEDSALLDETLAGFDLDSAAEVRLGDLALDADETLLEADDDLARLAAAFDAQSDAAAMPTHGAVSDLDFLDLSDATEQAQAAPAPPPIPVVEPVAEPAKSPPKASSFNFGSLSLEPMHEGEASVGRAPPAAQPAQPKPAAARFDFDALGLSLEPLEETTRAADAPPARFDAADLDLDLDEPAPAPATATDSRGIDRIVVLGASIGGPDALRSFLAEIPPGFPALFLLAQHLDSGFFEKLAEQLQKVSQLPVRLPSDGMRLGSGEVLVVSANERVRVDRQGNLRLEPHDNRPAYSPSIDTVLRDAADIFGPRALAIIFSGMAGDAIEGATHLAARGGEVWVQDPSSCVVSSMVDGIRSRGLAEVVASPRELARQLVERFSRSG